MKEPTDAEIATEIQALKDMKPKVPQYSMFGDDNWGRIDTAIRALEDLLTEEEIDEEWPELGDPMHTAAYDAMLWRTGEQELDDESPAEGWKELAKGSKS